MDRAWKEGGWREDGEVGRGWEMEEAGERMERIDKEVGNVQRREALPKKTRHYSSPPYRRIFGWFQI